MYVEIIGDGRIFEGVDMKQVVIEMKRNDFSCPPTVKKYMETVRDRLLVSNGEAPPVDKVSSFLRWLEDNKFIRIK